MKIQSTNDTICAISTPIGASGIGIVRLSGKNALKIADKIFMPRNGRKPSQMPGYTVHYGHIVRRIPAQYSIRNTQYEIIDEVLLTVMRAPKSYTKEDIVEINAHGGTECLRKILDLAVSHNARVAEPGEFTKRAFLNGRLDLSQAEAVLDIINARTESSLRVAQRQLCGELSKVIKSIKMEILDIRVNIEAGLDFPDEELQPLDAAVLLKKLNKCIFGLGQLLEDFHNGMILRNGITAVICGKANVGKSTLMNRLLKYERAIVTPVAGTTTDTIEEAANIKGIPLKLVDTAGLMQTDNEISKEGISRTKKYIKSADLVLLVFDSSSKFSKQDMEVINAVKDKKLLVIINKTDLPPRLNMDRIKECLAGKKIIGVSAKKNKNIDKLCETIVDMVWSGGISVSDGPLLTNVRHKHAIAQALKLLESANAHFNTEHKELIAQDLKEAQDNLGLVTGENFTENLLDEIFSQFCIGK